MTIYTIDYNELVVEPIQVADDRYTPSDIKELYGEFFITKKDATDALEYYIITELGERI